MRLLRVFVLLLISAAVYLAQFIFEHHSLVSLFPDWLFVRFPNLYPLILQPPGDLLNLAFLLSACATFTFGFWTPLWEQPLLNNRNGRLVTRFAKARRLRQWVAMGCFALSVASIGLVLYQIRGLGVEATFVHFVWAGGVLLHLVGCILLQPLLPRHSISVERNANGEQRRWRRSRGTIPYFWGLLLVMGTLCGWQLTAPPPTVDAVSVAIGLQAAALARGDETQLFLVEPNSTDRQQHPLYVPPPDVQTGENLPSISILGTLSPISSLTAALVRWGTSNAVLSLRLPGLAAALLALVGAWLFACEFFRRSPPTEPTPTMNAGRTINVDGSTDGSTDGSQGSALLTAAFFAVTGATFYFSRTPLLLEVVAWGTLGCWALLYGVRDRDQVAVGLSGVLIGLSALLYRSGLVFVVTGLFWLVYARQAIVQEAASRRIAKRPTASWLGMVWLWGLGVGVTLAPQIALWLRFPAFLRQFFSGEILQNVGSTLLAFHVRGTASELWGNPTPLLHGLAAPLFLLGLGVVLFALNRWQGWLLFTWLGSGVLLASIMRGPTPSSPDLLPLLPVTALVIALGVDRLRWLILQNLGPWFNQTLLFLLVGLILWIGQTNWVDYHEFMRNRANEYALIAGALYDARPTPSFLVVDSAAQIEQLCQPDLIRLFAERAGQRCEQRVVTVEELPDPSAALGVQLLIRVQDSSVLKAIQKRYPQGVLRTGRDAWANPVFYIYTC